MIVEEEEEDEFDEARPMQRPNDTDTEVDEDASNIDPDLSTDDYLILDEVDRDQLDKDIKENNARLELLERVLEEESKVQWDGSKARKEEVLKACIQKWEERDFRKARQSWQFCEIKAMEEVTRMRLTLKNAEEHLYHVQCGRQDMEKMEENIRETRRKHIEAVIQEDKMLDEESRKQKERIREVVARKAKRDGKRVSDLEKEDAERQSEARQKSKNVWLRRPKVLSVNEFQARLCPPEKPKF
jgi:hypothetical protein